MLHRIFSTRPTLGPLRTSVVDDAYSDLVDRVDTVAAAVEPQLAATHEISRNVQLASNGTLQVATDIGHVREGSTGTGAASAQLLTSVTRLSSGSGRLKQKVDEFLKSRKSPELAG